MADVIWRVEDLRYRIFGPIRDSRIKTLCCLSLVFALTASFFDGALICGWKTFRKRISDLGLSWILKYTLDVSG